MTTQALARLHPSLGTQVWTWNLPTSPVMRMTWALIALASILFLAGAPIAGFTIAWHEFWTAPALSLTVAAAGLLLRAQGRFQRVANAAEAASALGLLAFSVPLLTSVLARTALPLADAKFIRVDAFLGIDWLSLASMMKHQEAAALALCYAYASLMYQPAVLVVLLAAAGYAARLERFVLAWAIALAITVAVFPFAPAVGGYLHYGLTPQEFPFVRVPAPFMYGKVLLAARDGSMTELGRLSLEGIVAFPSFHTAAAVMLAWGFWHLRWLRWPALALNIAMIASCPFAGAHYIIDLIAGGLVAWLAIALTVYLETLARLGRVRADQETVSPL